MVKYNKKKATILMCFGLALLYCAEFHLFPKPAFPGAGIFASFLMTTFVSLAYLATTMGVQNIVKRST